VVRLSEFWIAATINECLDDNWSVPALSEFFNRVVTLDVGLRARPLGARRFRKVLRRVEREHGRMQRHSKPIALSDMAMRVGQQVDYELDAFDAAALSAHLGAFYANAQVLRFSMMGEAVGALLKADYAHALDMHEHALDTMSGKGRLSLAAAVHHLAAGKIYFRMARREADGRKKEMLLGAYRHAVLAGEGEVMHYGAVHEQVKLFSGQIGRILDGISPPVTRTRADVPRRVPVAAPRPAVAQRLWK
jgi:hypothetical protein